MFVTKLNPAGTATLYTTYLSGVSSATALAIDSSGNAYVTGYTTSSSFPASPKAWRTTTAVGDSYVVKLNATGSQLLYATLLTGHNASNATTGIAVNAHGVDYVTGYTTDQQFPVTAGAFQSTYTSGASAQGFVSAVAADGSSLVASTYLGGNNRTVSNGIALDSSSQPVVTGYLGALGGPIATPDTFLTTAGAYQTAAKGGLEGFVTKLNAACSALVFSTYLGGSGTDAPRAIALDTTGNVYVTGYTKSLDYPVTSGAATPNGVGFYSRLDAAGAHLQYSTYLATESGPGILLSPASEFSLCESGLAIAVDSNHTAYIVGLALGHFRVPATPGSLFSTSPSRSDAAFLVAYNPAGLQYGTYLGGPDVNSFSYGYAVTASGVAVDPANNVYFAVTTSDRNMPSTPGALLAQDLAPNNTAFAGKIDTSPTVCNGTISASPASFPMAGGSGTLTVYFPAGCPYAILSDNGITFNAPISGTGTQQIPFVVAPNPVG